MHLRKSFVNIYVYKFLICKSKVKICFVVDYILEELRFWIFYQYRTSSTEQICVQGNLSVYSEFVYGSQTLACGHTCEICLNTLLDLNPKSIH